MADPLTIDGADAAPPAGLDPADRDAMIRTVIAEGGASPDGWGAVANTIKNRLATGKFGDSPAAVVHAPGQFEVWQDGSAAKVDPSSPAYAAAGRVVDAVAAGQLPDNTNGATHFFSPSGQAARAGDGRALVPAWATSPIASVGGNVFFAPNGRVTYASAGAAPSGQGGPAATVSSQPQAAAASPDDAAFMARWGLPSGGDAPGAPSPGPVAADPPSTGDDAAFLQRWGVGSPATQPAAAAGASAGPGSPPSGASDRGAAVAGLAGFLDGVPIAGPALLGGSERLGAVLGTVRNGDTYADELARIQAEVGATDAAHPTAGTVGRVGGAIVGMAPALEAAPGLLGAAGTLGERMTMGGLSGATIGATDARVRDENPLTGAAFGGAGGVAGPLVGNALGTYVGKGTNALLDAGSTAANLVRTGSTSGLPGYSRAAANVLTKAAGYDGGGNALMAGAQSLGPDATVMDVGPSMRGLALGATANPSEAKSTVENFVNGRAAGSNDRVMNALGAALGPDRDPVGIAQQIEAARTAATAPVYSRALADAPPVDVSGVVAGIDHDLQTAVGAQARGLQFLRNNLVTSEGGVDAATGAEVPPTYETNAQRLLYLRQELDKALGGQQEGLGLRPSAVTRADRSITQARGALDEALKQQVPGLADVDGAFSHSADVQGAVENGYRNVLGALGPHPDSFAAARAGMDPDVAAGENAGIAGRVYRTFGTGTQRDAVKLDRLLAGGDDGYNTQNLRTAFGDEPVNALLGTVNREKIFADTTNKITQNSVTARVQGGAQMLADAEPGSTNLLSASLAGVGLQAAKSALVDPLVRSIMASPNAPVALEVARALTAQGASRDEILTQLARLGGQQDAIGSGSNALLLAGNRAGQAAAAGAGETNRTPALPSPANLLTGR